MKLKKSVKKKLLYFLSICLILYLAFGCFYLFKHKIKNNTVESNKYKDSVIRIPDITYSIDSDSEIHFQINNRNIYFGEIWGHDGYYGEDGKGKPKEDENIKNLGGVANYLAAQFVTDPNLIYYLIPPQNTELLNAFKTELLSHYKENYSGTGAGCENSKFTNCVVEKGYKVDSHQNCQIINAFMKKMGGSCYTSENEKGEEEYYFTATGTKHDLNGNLIDGKDYQADPSLYAKDFQNATGISIEEFITAIKKDGICPKIEEALKSSKFTNANLYNNNCYDYTHKLLDENGESTTTPCTDYKDKDGKYTQLTYHLYLNNNVTPYIKYLGKDYPIEGFAGLVYPYIIRDEETLNAGVSDHYRCVENGNTVSKKIAIEEIAVEACKYYRDYLKQTNSYGDIKYYNTKTKCPNILGETEENGNALSIKACGQGRDDKDKILFFNEGLRNIQGDFPNAYISKEITLPQGTLKFSYNMNDASIHNSWDCGEIGILQTFTDIDNILKEPAKYFAGQSDPNSEEYKQDLEKYEQEVNQGRTNFCEYMKNLYETGKLKGYNVAELFTGDPNGNLANVSEDHFNCGIKLKINKCTNKAIDNPNGSGKVGYYNQLLEAGDKCTDLTDGNIDPSLLTESEDRCVPKKSNLIGDTSTQLLWKGETNTLMRNVGLYINKDDPEEETKLIVDDCNFKDDNDWDIKEFVNIFGVEACDYLRKMVKEGYLSYYLVNYVSDVCRFDNLGENPSNNLGEGCEEPKEVKMFGGKTKATIYRKNGYRISSKEYNNYCGYDYYFSANGGTMEGEDSCKAARFEQFLDSYNAPKYSFETIGNENYCVYKAKSKTNLRRATPSGKGMYQCVPSNKFVGWSRDKNCEDTIINPNADQSVGLGKLTIGSTSNAEGVYYACYETNYGSYENCPPLTDDFSNLVVTDNKTKIKKECNIEDDNDMSSLRADNVVIRQEEYNNENRGNFPIDPENKYCFVRCTEELHYIYPNVFQTVKAGTYYEFLYNPEVVGKKVCRSAYSVREWRDAYQNALIAEQEAYYDLEIAQSNLNYLETCNEEKCPTSTCGCDKEGKNCKTKYKVNGLLEISSFDVDNYKVTDVVTKGLDPKPTSTCGDDNFISDLKAAYEDDIKSYEEELEKKQTERVKLERYNLQCNTVLDNYYQGIEVEKNKSIVPEDERGVVFNDNSTNNEDNISQNKKDCDNEGNCVQYTVLPKVYVENEKNGEIGVNREKGKTSNYKTFSDLNKELSKVTVTDSNGNVTGETVNLYEISDSYLDEDEFYNLDPKIEYYDPLIHDEYQELEKNLDGYSYRLIKDTGSYTEEVGDELEEKEYQRDIYHETYEINYGNNANGYTKVEFTSNYNQYFTRESVKYIEYRPSKLYYTNRQNNISGDYTTTSCKDCTKIGYVYPVPINGTDLRKKLEETKVSFRISGQLGDIITEEDIASNNVFACNYDITNDILSESKDDNNETVYKSNTYIRPVTPTNIDPNDRKGKGLLGRNWASEKGQELIKIIQEKSVGNNTYNPENLEYSFTIGPAAITNIRDYNTRHPYTEFTNDTEKDGLHCNSAGLECTSDFLEKDNLDKLGVIVNKFQNVWKYYYNSATRLNEWTSYKDNTSPFSGANAKEKYNKVYSETGVLP